MDNRNKLKNIIRDLSVYKGKVSIIFKSRSFTIFAFVLIIASIFLYTKVISAAELVVGKLGATPYSAEISVSGDSKRYELVGNDLDALMLYLDNLKLRKILLSNNLSYSVRPDVGENYSIYIKTNLDDSGNYNYQIIYLNMNPNGKLYLRLHFEGYYRITEPDSLKGLYELLKNI